ncbi:MAG: riboflavin synthase [Bifidobacteriaceae bacterium]|jgi:riboflavin synthase|nr:riboflavin synthase [Bifidobacteriaceae bacterium]
MFTGIIEELGQVVRGEANRLEIRGPRVAADARRGDSIAVAGVCLTVNAIVGEVFTVDVMPETLRRTTVGGLRTGDRVNLERAMRADGRLGGHIVQGHVDGIAHLAERAASGPFETFRFTMDPAPARYVAPKGSIAIDGTSLTVIDITDDAGPHHPGMAALEVGLIPTTLRSTTLGALRPGDPVNIEVDVLAKYVERLLAAGKGPAA